MDRLYQGDNKILLSDGTLDRYLGKVDLIYIDPPYNTGEDQETSDGTVAYGDEHGGLHRYLEEMAIRP